MKILKKIFFKEVKITPDIYAEIKHSIRKSDHFEENMMEFLKAAVYLVKNKICKPRDFENFGGWCISVDQSCYFIYPENITSVKKKILLNISTGEITRNKKVLKKGGQLG